MRHTVNRIAFKINDYKVCGICQSINWYENEECINCNNEPVVFEEFTEIDAKALLDEYEENEWDTVELDV